MMLALSGRSIGELVTVWKLDKVLEGRGPHGCDLQMA